MHKRNLERRFFEDKVIDFILELASITDRDSTVDELMRDESEAAGQSKSAKSPPKKKKAAAKKATTKKKTAAKKVTTKKIAATKK